MTLGSAESPVGGLEEHVEEWEDSERLVLKVEMALGRLLDR